MQDIEIIEAFQKPKGQSSPCEDRLVLCENFVAVTDGATAKGQLLWNGHTSGFRAAQIIENVLRELASRATIYDFRESATKAIREYYSSFNRTPIVTKKNEERLTASVVVFSRQRKEIWMIGDCIFRVNGINYRNDKLADKHLARIRSEVDLFLLGNGHTTDSLQQNDIGRAFISSTLRDLQYFGNADESREYSYAVIDGFKTDMSKTICMAVPEHSEIVLASDGYPELFGSLSETEEHLQRMLQSDPLCISENKQTKGLMKGNDSYDDRTYVRFII